MKLKISNSKKGSNNINLNMQIFCAKCVTTAQNKTVLYFITKTK